MPDCWVRAPRPRGAFPRDLADDDWWYGWCGGGPGGRGGGGGMPCWRSLRAWILDQHCLFDVNIAFLPMVGWLLVTGTLGMVPDPEGSKSVCCALLVRWLIKATQYSQSLRTQKLRV